MTKLSSYTFEIGAIRPPSEGGSYSLLIRLTRNCAWARCAFCYATVYDRQKFELRTLEEIKKDIQAVKAIRDEIARISWELGYAGQVNPAVGQKIIQNEPELNGSHSFFTVYNWLASGAGTAFLQDADSLIMRTPDLIEAVKYLKETFPSLQRITSYARAKTVYRKTPEELSGIRTAGLTRLHIGLESGDDELLQRIAKGVTSEEQIEAGRKAKQSGFELSLYIMPGLGGRTMAEQHARNTARVLNAIDPHYIRSRPFVPRPDTPLFEEYESDAFQLTSPHERLRELKILIEGLNVTSHVCFDHVMNGWRQESGAPLFSRDYEGYQFPQDKPLVLALIEEGLLVPESQHVSARDLMTVGRL